MSREKPAADGTITISSIFLMINNTIIIIVLLIIAIGGNVSLYKPRAVSLSLAMLTTGNNGQ